MYTYPEMPLLGRVEIKHEGGPFDAANAYPINCSLSPIRPEEYFLGTPPQGLHLATHIIRTQPGLGLIDSFEPTVPDFQFPCSVFEIPTDSGHFYAAEWAHEVGAGFPNHHARVFAYRLGTLAIPPCPPYIGWI